MPGTLRKLIATVTLSIGMFAATQYAAAAVLTWTFADVSFDDGGTLTGSFDYDADLDAYSNINISVAGGDDTFFPDFTYSDASSTTIPITGPTDLTVRDNDVALGNLRRLLVQFADPLTNAGGTIAVENPDGLGGDSEFRTLPSSPPFGHRGFLQGGTVHAIPEPSSALFMLALILGGAALVRWRRS